MLQYPVQLPPLSLSSSPKNASRKDSSDYYRSNDQARPPPNSLNNKRFQKESFSSRSAFAGFHPPPALPLSISTNHHTTSPSSSPSPASAKLPRTPYLSTRQPSGPVSFPNSQPWAPSKSFARSNQSSIASSTVEDVLAPGDFVGEGGSLQGETIRLVSFGSTSHTSGAPEPATEFVVKRRLGHGSYAVVYLVQEVLSRPQPSEDGHMSTIGVMEFDSRTSPLPEMVYGREYAIKCLSKANLDEEDLAAQMSEVCASVPVKKLSLFPSPSGYNSPISALTPKYCYPAPHFRDFFVFTSSPGVRSRRRFILFFGTGPRPLRHGHHTRHC